MESCGVPPWSVGASCITSIVKTNKKEEKKRRKEPVDTGEDEL